MNFLSGFNRDDQITRLRAVSQWDIIVIGGGATGLGVALDAACRGYKTVLLEQHDFAKGTSSRSTKLIHGGVRYLAQGNIRLVYDALRERGLLLRNAPHLVKTQPFIIPCYNRISKYKYLAGLKLYDWLSKGLSLGSSKLLSADAVLQQLPHINQKKLIGGVQYCDAQFDDARLAINLAQTCFEEGALVLNHVKVKGILKSKGKSSGVVAEDKETGETFHLTGKAVINATGVFVDDILQLDTKGIAPILRVSQGVHLVFPRSILNSQAALMIPKTADGRVLFAIPWHEHVLVGTTDTAVDQHSLEPMPLRKEISFILETVREYLSIPVDENNALSVFAGLRPLAASPNKHHATKEISRDHKLMVSGSGLITITGGKWTTYRKMAEDTVNKAIGVGALDPRSSSTMARKIHGWKEQQAPSPLASYGADAGRLEALMNERPAWKAKLLQGFDHTEAEVVWAVRYEMARTVEDVLARRLRILFLNARAAKQAAPRVAELLCTELDRDEDWKQQQLLEFNQLANQYLPETYL